MPDAGKARPIVGDPNIDKTLRARAEELSDVVPVVLEAAAQLAARIERLRDRLRKGDPDMTADEIEAAIARAEAKRVELEAQQPEARQTAKVLAVLPRAAEEIRHQVALGLDGNPRAALKARVFLREWFSGKIRLEPLADGGLMAHWDQNTAALLPASERVVAGAGFEPATFGL